MSNIPGCPICREKRLKCEPVIHDRINAGHARRLPSDNDFSSINIQQTLIEIRTQEDSMRQLQREMSEIKYLGSYLQPDDRYNTSTFDQLVCGHDQISAASELHHNLLTVEGVAYKHHDLGDLVSAARLYRRLISAIKYLDSVPGYKSVATSMLQRTLLRLADVYAHGEPSEAETCWLEVLTLNDIPQEEITEIWTKLTQSFEMYPSLSADAATNSGRTGNLATAPIDPSLKRLTDSSRIPPLHRVIAACGSSVCNIIADCSELEFGRRDSYERTPLFLCALLRREHLGEVLIRRFPHPSLRAEEVVNARDGYGQSVLAQAVYSGCSLAFIKQLIVAGADLNPKFMRSNVLTPLQAAAKLGRLDVVDFLLSNGAAPDLAFFCEANPIDIALKLGHYDVFELLHKRRTGAGLVEDVGTG